jgi:catechol 2,3-dioxygenase-like lactoylglutathione lyase family enzyme
MRLSGPTLDASDAIGLAEFYERLLGWPITDRIEVPRPDYPPGDGWAMLRSPSGHLKIEIQGAHYYTPPVWPPVPGEQQMMVHLDIAVDDLDAAVSWAIEAGAKLADHQPQSGARVMLDPAGHPFCLFPGST